MFATSYQLPPLSGRDNQFDAELFYPAHVRGLNMAVGDNHVHLFHVANLRESFASDESANTIVF